MIAALTGAGLAAAAGLNAFIPLVIVGLFARFTSFIDLPSQLAWLESWPAIIISLALLALELVLDKIPGVDHVNDLLQSIVRPVVGGIIFAAAAASTVVDDSNFWKENPLIAGVVGALIAAAVHTGKAASRPAVNAATGGTGAPLASFAEDATAVALSLIAIFVPILVFFIFIGMGFAFYRIITTGRRRRRRRLELEAEGRAEREAEALASGRGSWWRRRWREGRDKEPRAPRDRSTSKSSKLRDSLSSSTLAAKTRAAKAGVSKSTLSKSRTAKLAGGSRRERRAAGADPSVHSAADDAAAGSHSAGVVDAPESTDLRAERDN
ncbi:DUF4126 domain-containing protein [Demequina oxidasica]|uniref:DUF4126 domain-containing protein n=1 Tax=Demequina oxidasica TaxID=676199 RepID=UPI000A023845|nr:DUF4126 domain-containing protein [Demequina oxidasica]